MYWFLIIRCRLSSSLLSPFSLLLSLLSSSFAFVSPLISAQLYVLGQNYGVVDAFNATSGRFITRLLHGFPDSIEQVILSPC